MPTPSYWDEPRPVAAHFETAAQARSARERAQRVLGVTLPKSPEEIRVEQEAAREQPAQE